MLTFKDTGLPLIEIVTCQLVVDFLAMTGMRYDVSFHLNLFDLTDSSLRGTVCTEMSFPLAFVVYGCSGWAGLLGMCSFATVRTFAAACRLRGLLKSLVVKPLTVWSI